MLPLPKLYRQGLRTLIVFVLFSVTASQFHAVSAVEEVDKYSARAAMVDAAVSGGPAQRAVALSALRKGDQEIKEAANQELASAELSDLRYSLSIIAQVGGSLTGQRAHELITNNDRLAMTDFIMGGWQKTQESDDRKEVEKLAQGDSDSVVTSRAKEVLPGNGESLASFWLTNYQLLKNMIKGEDYTSLLHQVYLQFRKAQLLRLKLMTLKYSTNFWSTVNILR